MNDNWAPHNPYDAIHNGGTHEYVVLGIPTGPTAPAAPSNLSATAVSSSRINLSWTDNASNESGFKIERKKSTDPNFVQIATVGVNATSYSNTGLQSNTTYNYRVRAYNQYGNSGYSNTATATTQSVPPITSVTIDGPDPATPGIKNFYTVNITGGSGNFDIQWYKRDSASGSNYYWYDGWTTTTDVTPGPTTFALRVDVTDNIVFQIMIWKSKTAKPAKKAQRAQRNSNSLSEYL